MAVRVDPQRAQPEGLPVMIREVAPPAALDSHRRRSWIAVLESEHGIERVSAAPYRRTVHGYGFGTISAEPLVSPPRLSILSEPVCDDHNT